MNFFKTSFWASISTGVTMLCGLITTKYVAMMIGPQGMAFVGQFSNTTVLIGLFASAACTSGVIKYLSEAKEPDRQRKIIANAIFLMIVCSLFMTVSTFLGAGLLSRWTFANGTFKDVFMIHALLILFPTLNGLISAILNGLARIKRMAILNIFVSIFNVGFILIGARYFGIKGVLLANVVAGSITFFINIRWFRQTGLLPRSKLIFNPDKKIVKLLLGYSLMTVAANVLAPAVQLFVRSTLLHSFNADTAGIWQANTRLSDYYLNFVYSVMGIYYLPKLSSLNKKEDLIKELKLGYLRIMPLVIAITITIWFCRHLLIKYLLTDAFGPMLDLLPWQLLGDVIKIAAWMLAYMIIAKALKKTYIILEIGYAVTSVVLNMVFIDKFGLIGSVYAFCVGYTLYFGVLTLIIRRYFKSYN